MVKKRKPSSSDTAAVVRRALKRNATRINDKQPITHINYKSEKANKGTAGKTTFAPRERDPYEATPPSSDLFERPDYKTGDGDVPIFQRPGSNHSHIKSKGLGT